MLELNQFTRERSQLGHLGSHSYKFYIEKYGDPEIVTCIIGDLK